MKNLALIGCVMLLVLAGNRVAVAQSSIFFGHEGFSYAGYEVIPTMDGGFMVGFHGCGGLGWKTERHFRARALRPHRPMRALTDFGRRSSRETTNNPPRAVRPPAPAIPERRVFRAG